MTHVPSMLFFFSTSHLEPRPPHSSGNIQLSTLLIKTLLAVKLLFFSSRELRPDSGLCSALTFLVLSVCVFFRMLSELSEWFWQERLWFPKGLGWADLEDRDGRVYAKARDLWVALPIALIFLIIRQLFERSVQLP